MTRLLSAKRLAQWLFDFMLWLLMDPSGDVSAKSPSSASTADMSSAMCNGLPDARMLMGVVEAEIDLDRPENDYPLFFRIGPLHVHSSKEEE